MFINQLYSFIAADQARMLAQEEEILAVARHVEMAQKQRILFNQKKDIAFLDKDKVKEERVFTLVADYAQNMYLPNFASSQPGATYYYSPLNTYCFGIVDGSTRPSKLYGHVYLEDLGKKGGDNVASMLWKQLKLMKLIPENNTKPATAAKEINIVMDNCRGQNKNNMVLRMLLLLVKLGVAKKARAIFLVRGHTKNDCNRLFNHMKKIYRKSDCFSEHELMSAIGSHEDVTPVGVVDGEFFDFNKVEDKYMKKLVSEVNQNHIFEVDTSGPGDSNFMTVYECDDAPPKHLMLVKPLYQHEDWIGDAMEELFGAPKPRVGLQEIKWLELYDKWRPLIPVERRTYYYIANPPPQSVRDKVKKHTKDTKSQRKERSRTEVLGNKAESEKADKEFGGKQPVASVPNTPQKI
jgi:hypothetical protein